MHTENYVEQDNEFFSIHGDWINKSFHSLVENIEEGTNTQQQQDGSFNAV